jgi:hypothetical protein
MGGGSAKGFPKLYILPPFGGGLHGLLGIMFPQYHPARILGLLSPILKCLLNRQNNLPGSSFQYQLCEIKKLKGNENTICNMV